MISYHLSHLEALESESIHIFREVAAEFERPVLLFSGGKDSICMLRLAEKAFRPDTFPFPLMHVDTNHNFPELIDFRDRRAEELGEKLIVKTLDEAIEKGIVTLPPNESSRNRAQIPVLLHAIEEYRFDAAIGGARRDEEKARAKERIFSHRDAFGQWEPKKQRPEIWNIYNAKIHPGEHMRIFPLSNWTEMDVWEYIQREELDLPSIYFSHSREVVMRDNQWLPVSDLLPMTAKDEPQRLDVRVRTIGDISCTGMFESKAATIDEIIAEVAAARVTERGSRADDKTSEAAMEDRKREGYF